MTPVRAAARPLRVAFAGTPPFAAQALRAITEAGHTVPLVWTQPDRPAGRGMKLQASAVKQLAQALGLPLGQPRGLRLDGRWADDAAAARAALQAAQADVMVVAAYGLILPAWVLTTPRLGCLNIHGSLLPRWRGAAPIQRAIEAGDDATGITLMQMDEGLDTGAMLCSQALPIEAQDTSASLHDKLAALGASLVVQALEHAAAGTLAPVAQPAQGVNYAEKIRKEEGAIDWQQPAAQIERRVRAFDPFPGASFGWQGEAIKLWRAQVVDQAHGAAPGTVLAADATRLVVACGQQALALLEVQRPGGRRATVSGWMSQPQAPAAGARLEPAPGAPI